MKIYVVYRTGLPPSHVFLDKNLAEQYVDKLNTSPFKVDHYLIKEMQPSDEIFSQAKFVVTAVTGLEVVHGGKGAGVSFSFFLRNQNNMDDNLEQHWSYREEYYTNSTKVRKQRIGAVLVIEEYKTEKDIDKELYKRKYKALLENLLATVNSKRTDGWSVSDINSWLEREHFVPN